MFSQSALAVEKPRSLATDHRIKVVSYVPNQVVPVRATTFTTTQIVFGKAEVIEDIQNGDLDAWTVSVQKQLPNMMFIKPTIVGSKTNLTVITNKHTYYFHLISVREGTSKTPPTYAIQFIYPRQQQTQLIAQLNAQKQQRHTIANAKKNPAAYHWDYSFHGSRSIMPLHVFDDGHFTYLQLRPNQDVPAIFAVTNKAGKESVVNYRRVGNTIVIQRVAPQFTLRDGKYAVATIFNNRLIAKMRHAGRN